jgi:hypothetical protein
VLFIDHVVELPVPRRRVTLTDMGLMMSHSLMVMVVVVLLMTRFNLIQQTLKLLGDFLRQIIWPCTSKL